MKYVIQFHCNHLWRLALLFLVSTSLHAQVTKVSDKVIGGDFNDEGRIVLTTSDGGYILGGISNSNQSGDKSEDSRGEYDYWVVKYKANGDKEWDKRFGGPDYENLTSLIATPDGGYLLGGASVSNKGGDKSEDNHGELDQDFWVVKISSDGTKQWDKTIGGTGGDYLTSMAVLPDNQGYLVMGESYSNASGDKSDNSKGETDYWVVKIGLDGQKIWDKTIGGSGSDTPISLLPTSDGNYLLAGHSTSGVGGDKSANAKGAYDYWLVKINASGTVLWDKTIGSPDTDYLASITPTADNGFLLGGNSYAGIGYDKSESALGRSDFWIVKINSDGTKQWDKTLGANKDEVCQKVLALADGGYLVGGYSDSNTGATKSENNRGAIDYWVVKLTSDGQYVWDKTLGGDDNDILNGLAQTATGDLLLLGESGSGANGDKTQEPLGTEQAGDFWLVVLKESECTTPTLSFGANVALPVLQNTPGVTLTIDGCASGRITWMGPNGDSGIGPTIPVTTSATGSVAYSVTCTRGSCTATLSPTVAIAAPTVTGAFDGYVYGADCSSFRGWAWNGNKPNTPVTVEILDGAKVIAAVPADVFRPDLQTAGKGNGNHAFILPIPAEVKDYESHVLSARIRGSSFILKGSPKILICSFADGPPDNKPPVAPTPTVLIAPLAAQVGVPFSGTLVAFTDPEGDELSHWIEPLPSGLQFDPDTRVLSGTPFEAGIFVVTYSANDNFGNANSVSFQITIHPASTTSVTGSFEGYLDKVECGTIRGWVWDRNKPNTSLTVELYTDGTVWGSVVANIYRDDLKNAGKGNGVHAYSFTVPPALKDNTTRLIYGRVQGSTYVLKDSGKPLTCPSPVRLSAETGSGLQVTVLGNPVSGQSVEVEVRGAEGQPLRLQLTDASGRLVSQRQIEAAKAIEQQTLSVGQQPAGLLLLRVSSGLKSLTLKVLKQ